MKIKQYKIARRLGVRLFPKTENHKFILTKRTQRTKKKFSRPISEFGLQLLEKQKTRYYYGLRERQFANYVNRALQRKESNSVDYLYRLLESRLDNVVYRLGFAGTRAFGRQMVNHGHVTVNGRKVSIPSFEVKEGDVVAIRKESRDKAMVQGMVERLEGHTPPSWLMLNAKEIEGKVEGIPTMNINSDSFFNLISVIEFYSR